METLRSREVSSDLPGWDCCLFQLGSTSSVGAEASMHSRTRCSLSRHFASSTPRWSLHRPSSVCHSRFGMATHRAAETGVTGRARSAEWDMCKEVNTAREGDSNPPDDDDGG